jgi:hypothetical protein
MTSLHFAMQFREGVSVSHGEYLLVNAGYANDIIGAKWFVPFDDELGYSSLLGTDEEQEQDCSDDDWRFDTTARDYYPHRRIE